MKYIGGNILSEIHCGFILGTNMDSFSCVTSLYPNGNNNNNNNNNNDDARSMVQR